MVSYWLDGGEEVDRVFCFMQIDMHTVIPLTTFVHLQAFSLKVEQQQQQ